ncbi:MAG TPA: DUF1786 domain-containing protein [Chloroflexota bacterium]
MRVLAVDVGTGTQDILLFDSDQPIENCVQLVMPSPTVVVADRIRRATAAGRPVVLTGVMMGGGPCHWAAMDHLRAGFPIYATPEVARTFDDDLENVARMGVTLVDEVEAEAIRDAERVVMRDFWYDAILSALRAFGVEDEPDAVAVAVFDHGNAPPGVSDRVFRFDYLAERVRQPNPLAALAYFRDEIPPSMTRLQAVASTCSAPVPLLVMDTAPAAALGALEDPRVRAERETLLVNVGNFHTLAFHIEDRTIRGLFEHHTGELTREELERYLVKLAEGTLTNQEVYDDMGHGALIVEPPAERPDRPLPFTAVTGPRRDLLKGSPLAPYLAVPHGDMMLAGCFGLLRAYAAKDPAVAEVVEARLGPPAL